MHYQINISVLQTLAKQTAAEEKRDMSYLERRQKEGEEETGPTAFYLRYERSSHRLLPRTFELPSLRRSNFRNICLVKEK